MSILRNFAVIEGCDGSGTSTQLTLLSKRPTAGLFHLEAEPTKGPIGLLVRRVLNGGLAVHPETLARLFAADRSEHLYGSGGIVERCGRGEIVVSDRYTPSSMVYQGLECGKRTAESLNESFPLPELLVYLDVETKTAMERIINRIEHTSSLSKTEPAKPERYETEDFLSRVRESYRALLPRYRKAGVRVLDLDGTKPPDELADEIWRALREMPILKG
jgi:dTMP kinase